MGPNHMSICKKLDHVYEKTCFIVLRGPYTLLVGFFFHFIAPRLYFLPTLLVGFYWSFTFFFIFYTYAEHFYIIRPDFPIELIEIINLKKNQLFCFYLYKVIVTSLEGFIKKFHLV